MSHRRIYHVPHGTPYRVENSLRGVRRAARLGYDAIDLDLQITSDGVVVCTHWGQPLLKDGFYDPLGRIKRTARVRDLTWRQVQRLRTRDGYRIRRLRRVLKECRRVGIEACVEPKADSRFKRDRVWTSIRADADHTKARVSVRSLRNLPIPGAGTRRVKAARRAGFEAWTI